MVRDVQSFCPHCNFTSFHNDRVFIEKKPLFSSMLFLYIDDDQIENISSIRNVTRFLYWTNSIAEVSQKDISHIYNFSNSFGNIQVEKCPVNPGAAYTDSLWTEDDNGSRIIVRLNSIGYQMISKKEDLYFKNQDPPVLGRNYFIHSFKINNSFKLAL